MRLFYLSLFCCFALACDSGSQDDGLGYESCMLEKQNDTRISADEVSAAVAPFEPTPSPAQLEWQQDELYLFVHFGINTFTGEEWGDGTASPMHFNPSQLDVEQWVTVAKDAGFKGLIITAKHHEGFALWPTALSDYSVAQSPWEEGRGDVLKLLSDATHKAGLKFGIYVSPWDRHEPTYGTEAYHDFFVGQLTELLTGYGDVFEVWLDGARDRSVMFEYDYERYFQTIRSLQPHALIANLGPDIRWVGNEIGEVPEQQYSFTDQSSWYPVECDVPIRPHWFWRKNEDNKVKSPLELLDLYFGCVGKNGTLLLGISPNKEGRIPALDQEHILNFGFYINQVFKTNVLEGERISATSEKNGGGWRAANVIDSNPSTFWIAEDSVKTASVEISVSPCNPFNILELKEPIQYGQRVDWHRIESWNGDEWVTIAEGSTIGYKRLYRVPEQLTSKIKITVHSDRTSPALEDIGAYSSQKLEAFRKLRDFDLSELDY